MFKIKIKFQNCLELNLIWYRNFENSLFKTKFLSKEFFLFEKNKKSIDILVKIK